MPRKWKEVGVLPYNTTPTISCKDDNGSNGTLQSSVKVCEGLDIQHVNLVNE